MKLVLQIVQIFSRGRPSVAGAVLETPLSPSSKHHKSQTIRSRDLKLLHNALHLSHVTCHVSHVRCHMSRVICNVFFLYYYFTNWCSQSGVGLLSPGPPPSNLFIFFWGGAKSGKLLQSWKRPLVNIVKRQTL